MPVWLLDLRVWLAAAAASAALWGYVQTVRLDGCQSELTGTKAQIAVLGAQLDAQNMAVAALEADGKKRSAEAARALQDARKQAKGAQAQADRLQALLAQPRKPQASSCPSGDAVREIRRALAAS